MRGKLSILAGALLLAGCASVPEPRPVAPVVVAAPTNPYPNYRWTQGNAPKAL